MRRVHLLLCTVLFSATSGLFVNPVYGASNTPADVDNQFVLTPYLDNYLLPYYFTQKPDQDYFAPLNPNNDNISKANLQFQLSFKYGLLSNLVTDNDDIFVSYTQISNWQAYDKSAYFRDSQYQPEVFWRFGHQYPLLGWDWHQTSIGFMHQSNGKGGDVERSWNRAYVDLSFARGDVNIQVRPWLRIEGNLVDYNPDIEEYLGYGDMTLSWQAGRNKVTLTLRNQFESSFAKGYEELSWKFPIYKKLRGYLKLQSGYGLTISSYDHYDNAIGIGIAL